MTATTAIPELVPKQPISHQSTIFNPPSTPSESMLRVRRTYRLSQQLGRDMFLVMFWDSCNNSREWRDRLESVFLRNLPSQHI